MDTHTNIAAFIGGGNMASAIIGGLIKQGMPAEQILVIDPDELQRERLARDYQVQVRTQADNLLENAQAIVWAVKPQIFKEVAQATAPFIAANALHISVAAGIQAQSIAQWVGNKRIVRAMPNTPALVGQGMTGMFAGKEVSSTERALADQLMQVAGKTVWVEKEALIDAVVAVSGSGPAYMFYVLEAMEQAGVELGLTAEQAHELAVATMAGAAALAAQSSESVSTLRARVTSKGGTTFAAISHMENMHVKTHIMRAMNEAAKRNRELSDEFGKA